MLTTALRQCGPVGRPWLYHRSTTRVCARFLLAFFFFAAAFRVSLFDFFFLAVGEEDGEFFDDRETLTRKDSRSRSSPQRPMTQTDF